uniref:Uncharacterized protein n=1 Tax=Anser brachyrhynchus TaxID=132585 RepID=A0A8B9CF28_9AVES
QQHLWVHPSASRPHARGARGTAAFLLSGFPPQIAPITQGPEEGAKPIALQALSLSLGCLVKGTPAGVGSCWAVVTAPLPYTPKILCLFSAALRLKTLVCWPASGR